MNSRQLRWILSGDKFTKQFFRGVYAIDEIKSIKTVSYPSSFVINLDPSYKPGSHWVAVYLIKMVLANISIHLPVTLLTKLYIFYARMQKDGNTIVCKCNNFILRHVDNLLCFTSIKRVED